MLWVWLPRTSRSDGVMWTVSPQSVCFLNRVFWPRTSYRARSRNGWLHTSTLMTLWECFVQCVSHISTWMIPERTGEAVRVSLYTGTVRSVISTRAALHGRTFVMLHQKMLCRRRFGNLQESSRGIISWDLAPIAGAMATLGPVVAAHDVCGQ